MHNINQKNKILFTWYILKNNTNTFNTNCPNYVQFDYNINLNILDKIIFCFRTIL